MNKLNPSEETKFLTKEAFTTRLLAAGYGLGSISFAAASVGSVFISEKENIPFAAASAVGAILTGVKSLHENERASVLRGAASEVLASEIINPRQ